LVTMGGHLKDPVAIPDYPYDAADQAYMVDGQHQEARAELIGHWAQTYLAAYEAQLPTDGTPRSLGGSNEPKDITRFDAAQFTWVGGDNYFDDPHVIVQRKEGDKWVTAGDQSGEVILSLQFPNLQGDDAAPT